MINRWFVVVDDRFVDNPGFLGMSDSVEDEVCKNLCSGTMLIAIRERRTRWPDLLPKLVKIIERQLPMRGDGEGDLNLQVIILAHMACFNTTHNSRGESRNRIFNRFKAAEDELWSEVQRLDRSRHFDKLEVFGLHFEEGTPLYESLKSVLTKPEDFGELVIKVLDSSDPTALFERMSVVKHRIIGLFLPLDLALQNWAEEGDPRLRAEVDSRLPGKLEGARALLESAEVTIKGGGVKADTSKVRELLQASRVDARDAASFHAWINNLDQALDEVRRAVFP